MDTRNRSYTVEHLMEYLAWCWYSINICWKKSTCLGKVGRMLGGLDICPPFFHVFFQLFCLPSPHSTTNHTITAHSLSGIQKMSVQGVFTLCVCYFQENGCVQERAWPAWSCSYSWPPFYRNLPWNLWSTQRTSTSPQLSMGLLLCHLLTSSALFLCDGRADLLAAAVLSSTTHTLLGALFTSFPLHLLPRNAFSDLLSHISPFPPVSIQPPFKKVSWVALHMFICYSLYSATVHTQILMCNPGMIITDEKIQMNTWMRKTYKY